MIARGSCHVFCSIGMAGRYIEVAMGGKAVSDASNRISQVFRGGISDFIEGGAKRLFA